MLRGDGQINPDGVRDYDLLVPATVEDVGRSDARRAGATTCSARPTTGGGPSAGVRALLQRTTGATVRVDGEIVGVDRSGLVVLLGVGPADDEATAEALARRDRRAAHLPRRGRGGRTGRCWTSAARSSSSRSSRSSPTRAAAAGRGSPARRRRTSPSGSTSGSRRPSARSGSRSRPAGSAPRWRSSWSTTARSRCGWTPPSAGHDDRPSGRRPVRVAAGPIDVTVDRTATWRP